MKKLALVCLVFACVAASPRRGSLFDDDDDLFTSIFSAPKKPERPFWPFSFPGFSMQPFFSFMLDVDPLNNPKMKLHNNTVEEKVINGHTMTINSSYFVNEEDKTVVKTQTINVLPTKPKPPKENPATIIPVIGVEPETTLKPGKDSENDVFGPTNHESEVPDLVSS